MGSLAYKRIEAYDWCSGDVVEVGTEHGEGSTAFLEVLSMGREREFRTTDVDPKIASEARKNLGVMAYNYTGEAFFKEYRRTFSANPIAVAYLDGFDWPYKNMPEYVLSAQRARYKELGLDMTEINSQLSFLNQMILLDGLTIQGSLVVMDDTWYEYHTWQGKGGLATSWATIRGFTLLEFMKDPGNGGYVILRKE